MIKIDVFFIIGITIIIILGIFTIIEDNKKRDKDEKRLRNIEKSIEYRVFIK